MEVSERVSVLLFMFCFTSLSRHQSMETAVPGTFITYLETHLILEYEKLGLHNKVNSISEMDLCVPRPITTH